MRKIYKKLTEEQINKGVVFSSCLSRTTKENKDDCVHEVFKSDVDKNERIKRLKDDDFFNQSFFKYNIIRRF